MVEAKTDDVEQQYVIASDYDKLVEAVREIATRRDALENESHWGNTYAKSEQLSESITKALTLIGTGTTEGTSGGKA